MKPIKVGLLGLGTVGTGVVRIVEGHQEDLSNQVGSPDRRSRKYLVKDRTKGAQHFRRCLQANGRSLGNRPESRYRRYRRSHGRHRPDEGIYSGSAGARQAYRNREQGFDGVARSRNTGEGARQGLRRAIRSERSGRNSDHPYA